MARSREKGNHGGRMLCSWWTLVSAVWVFRRMSRSLSKAQIPSGDAQTPRFWWTLWRLAMAWNNCNVYLKIDQVFLTRTLNNNYVWLQRCWLIVYDNHLMVNIHIKPSSLTSFPGFIYPIYTMKVGMRERRQDKPFSVYLLRLKSACFVFFWCLPCLSLGLLP